MGLSRFCSSRRLDSPYFIAGTLFLALLFNSVTRGVFLPDMVALVLLFWSIQQPERVSVGVAFFLGLPMDALNGWLLGQQAVGYSLMSYLAILLHHRASDWSRLRRASYIFVILWLSKLVPSLIGSLAAKQLIDPISQLSVLLEFALWPGISWLLLLPQRRAEASGAAHML